MNQREPKSDTRTFTLDKTTAGIYRYRAVTDHYPAPVAWCYVERWFRGADTRTFVFDIATPGTYRYRAVTVGYPAPVRFVYFERWYLDPNPPGEFEVTVRELSARTNMLEPPQEIEVTVREVVGGKPPESVEPEAF